MGIKLSTNFDLNIADGIDSRQRVSTYTDLVNVPFKYAGLTTYVMDTKLKYVYDGTAWKLDGGFAPILTTPNTDDILKYNGQDWINVPSNQSPLSAGVAIQFFASTNVIRSISTDNVNRIYELALNPSQIQATITTTFQANTTPLLLSAFRLPAQLSRTTYDQGLNEISQFANVSNSSNETSIINSLFISKNYTTNLVTTGTGVTRTISASTPIFTNILGNINKLTAHYIETLDGLYQITDVSSSTVATISVPVTYVNKSNYTYCYLWVNIGTSSTNSGQDINAITPNFDNIKSVITTNNIEINDLDSLGLICFVTTTKTSSTDINFRFSDTYIKTSLASKHNNLSGLQGGNASEKFHITQDEYTKLQQMPLLNNVNNTADLDKPISIATQQALNDKQNNINFANGLYYNSNNLEIGDISKNTDINLSGFIYNFSGVDNFVQISEDGFRAGAFSTISSYAQFVKNEELILENSSATSINKILINANTSKITNISDNFILKNTNLNTILDANDINITINKPINITTNNNKILAVTTTNKVGKYALILDVNNVIQKIDIESLGGGSSSNFKGTYVDLLSLQTAHPTGLSGDYAIIDNINADAEMWIWDETENEWVMSSSGGLVTSVNNQIGIVTLTKTDIGLSNVPDVDATLRSNHTGSQLSNTISDFTSTVNSILAPELALKEGVITPGTVSDYYRGDKTWQILNKNVVGLSDVDNTSDLSKPISNSTQLALDTKENKLNVYQIVTSVSGVLTLDYAISKNWKITLNENITSMIISNLPDGGEMNLQLTQRAIAPYYTVMLPTSTKVSNYGQGTILMSNFNNAVDFVAFKKVGTILFADYFPAYN